MKSPPASFPRRSGTHGGLALAQPVPVPVSDGNGTVADRRGDSLLAAALAGRPETAPPH
ncbi:protein of unknown function [Nitrospira japonica]|uniref:Uncharacterized protein n=1 Tax=Nitrospira japonica TaxID=1325564 RepID=A0A1W1I440_9BACT|nr:protein of unknown function [Nitrospira japonica]